MAATGGRLVLIIELDDADEPKRQRQNTSEQFEESALILGVCWWRMIRISQCVFILRSDSMIAPSYL